MLFLISLLMVIVTPSDESDVRKLLERRENAWEKQDIAGLMEPFSEDCDYIDSMGNITTGRTAIEARYREIFASAKYKNSRSTQKIIKIRFVRPDTVVVTVAWTLSGLRSNDDLPLPDRKGTTVLVIEKGKENWGIVSLHAAVTPDEKTN